MSTHPSTTLRIDPARSRARSRNNALLIGGGVSLVAIGLAAGLIWRSPASSHEGWQAGGGTNVASASTLEPTSAGAKVAATVADAAVPASPKGETTRAVAAQSGYTPWSEAAPPAARPPAPVKRPSAAAPPVAEPQPPVAPWRPIESRQPADGAGTASEAPREAVPGIRFGDSRGEVVTAAADDPTPRERPRPRPMACHSCGTVQSVRPVQLAGAPVGLGAIAGGVVGGLLGNQVGSGNGRQAMTVIGAAGGGLAGHEIEKRMRGNAGYDVQIRMDDGSTRTLRRQSAPATGSRVRVEGDDLRPVTGEEPRFIRTGLVSR